MTQDEVNLIERLQKETDSLPKEISFLVSLWEIFYGEIDHHRQKAKHKRDYELRIIEILEEYENQKTTP